MHRTESRRTRCEVRAVLCRGAAQTAPHVPAVTLNRRYGAGPTREALPSLGLPGFQWRSVMEARRAGRLALAVQSPPPSPRA